MKEYNPLDYENLTRNCVQELMRRGPYELPLSEHLRPEGAGVYALFYRGTGEQYSKIASQESAWPIYVGKAVPEGARKGGVSQGIRRELDKRLREHVNSINAAHNLDAGDFMCRYLVVTPLWITMAEQFLIRHFQPVWNTCLDGFGNHAPGRGRAAGKISAWDALHPGRSWAKQPTPADVRKAADRLAAFLAKNNKRSLTEVLADAQVIDGAEAAGGSVRTRSAPKP